MPEYLSPGVYVEEVETGAMAIEGVSTSTVGFLGETERGPVAPEFVGSFAEFKRLYGGFAKYRRGKSLEGTNLAYAVQGFFRNGGSRCYVGRITEAEQTGGLDLGAYDPPMALRASPDAIEFEKVVTDRTVTETVELSHAGVENDPLIELSGITITGAGNAPDMYTALLPEGTTTPHTLAPGDPLLVEVVYQPTEKGSHNAALTVEHNGEDPPLQVPLSGKGVEPEKAAELGVSPPVVDYGSVPQGTATKERVTVENVGLEGAAPVTITGVSKGGSDPGAFTIHNPGDFSPAELTVGGDPMAIEVSVDHGTTERVDAVLDISLDSGGPVSVDLRADVVDPANTLGASAVELQFDDRVTNTSAERTIVITNMGASGDEALEIDSVGTSGDAAFSANLAAISTGSTLAPGDTTPVTVTFAPTSNGTSKTGQLEIGYLDSGGSSTLTVDLEGTGIEKEGTYGVRTPIPVDFGDVVTSESVTQSVVVANTAPAGATEITIDDVRIEADPDDEYSLPDDFIPDAAPPVATLGPGKDLEIPVTVDPAATGLVDATLAVDYTAGGATTTETYDLTARGIEAIVGFEAVGPGDWGGRVAVTVRNSARSNDTFDVTIRYWSELEAAEGTAGEVVAAQDAPDVRESYSDLTTKETSSNYYETVIESGSNLVEVTRHGSERPSNGTAFLTVPPEDDDAPAEVGLTQYTGDSAAPRGERTGLAGFAEVDDISIVTVPDENSVTGLRGEIRSHCERLADRFAILQAPQGAAPGDLPPDDAISEYAAIYYPHIEIIDPESSLKTLVPPGGHVAGIYARSDADHGVWKAPANETVRGAVDLEFPVTKADQDRLNPKGVNAIRLFPDRGIRVWGARTTSVNPQWKYVNVRRLFLYIEESIDEGTQWAVFESNTEKLWARVRQSVRNFLTTVWREGGLAGSSPEEAFYVKADRTTMTQTDIDQGKLIVEIGVAPVKPAEFVIFRITQWTEGQEGGS